MYVLMQLHMEIFLTPINTFAIIISSSAYILVHYSYKLLCREGRMEHCQMEMGACMKRLNYTVII